jgi:hypothetical protein
LISSPWSWSCSSGPWEWPCPPSTKKPARFDTRPNEPTIRISCGLLITGGSIRRVMASRTMERQSAMRNTALKKAPRISARSHCGGLATYLFIRRSYLPRTNIYLSRISEQPWQPTVR